MAVGHRLPNGYLVVLMTPREATLLRDQFLEPGEFPWDKSESQMVGAEVRMILTDLVAKDTVSRLGEASKELVHAMQNAEKKAKQAMNVWECPNCGARNDVESNECHECGYDREP